MRRLQLLRRPELLIVAFVALVSACEAGSSRSYYRESFPGGQLRRTGELRDGKPDGAWTVYRPDGRLAATQRYERGKLEGEGVIYDEQGVKAEEGRYHAGVRVGVWTRYEDGLPRRLTEYVDGGHEERWRVLFPDGTVQAAGTFREGKKQGAFVLYHPGGVKALEGELVDGLRKGRWVRWDEQGQVLSDEILDETEPYGMAEELEPG